MKRLLLTGNQLYHALTYLKALRFVSGVEAHPELIGSLRVRAKKRLRDSSPLWEGLLAIAEDATGRPDARLLGLMLENDTLCCFQEFLLKNPWLRSQQLDVLPLIVHAPEYVRADLMSIFHTFASGKAIDQINAALDAEVRSQKKLRSRRKRKKR